MEDIVAEFAEYGLSGLTLLALIILLYLSYKQKNRSDEIYMELFRRLEKNNEDTLEVIKNNSLAINNFTNSINNFFKDQENLSREEHKNRREELREIKNLFYNHQNQNEQ